MREMEMMAQRKQTYENKTSSRDNSESSVYSLAKLCDAGEKSLAPSLIFVLPSSPEITEEIVSRHSPLTGRGTRCSTPRLIKFAIVEMISGAATHTASLAPLYCQSVQSG